MPDLDTSAWERARLIPVSGIRNAEEQERRASSALLAVIGAVDEFCTAITKPLGAPKGRVETFIEVSFTLEDGRTVRPDGIICITRGGRTWRALIEVKTGNNNLVADQVEAYLDLAREQVFDCLITISNQIAKSPGEHPVDVDKRKLKKCLLFHLSWSRILTEAVMQKAHRGVADIDQAWILGELIRYLEHPNAGSVDFCDMGEHWVSVRDAVKDRTLRHTDNIATEVAGKWGELVTFIALRLGRHLGADVQQVLSAKERADLSVKIANIVDAMANEGRMFGAIRIPNTVGDIQIVADLRAQQIEVSVSIAAPKEGRETTKINWLVRQLKTAPPLLRIDCWGLRSRSSMSELLEKVRENPDLLIPAENREVVSFKVSLTQEMGHKRGTGRNSFIDSVIGAVEHFYSDVVQHLKEWQPAAPRLQKADAMSEESVTDKPSATLQDAGAPVLESSPGKVEGTIPISDTETSSGDQGNGQLPTV